MCHNTFSAFLRYSNLKAGDVQVLVGGKTESLPLVTYEEYLNLCSTEDKNVAKVWQNVAGRKKVV